MERSFNEHLSSPDQSVAMDVFAVIDEEATALGFDDWERLTISMKLPRAAFVDLPADQLRALVRQRLEEHRARIREMREAPKLPPSAEDNRLAELAIQDLRECTRRMIASAVNVQRFRP